jgi:hypothetical protein
MLRHAPDPGGAKLVPQGMHGFELQIAPKNVENDAGLGLVDNELAVFDIIAEGRHAAQPQTLFLRCGELVADPFTDDLALELGKGQKDVERQPSHARRRIKLLGDRNEGDAAAIKDLVSSSATAPWPGRLKSKTLLPR